MPRRALARCSTSLKSPSLGGNSRNGHQTSGLGRELIITALSGPRSRFPLSITEMIRSRHPNWLRAQTAVVRARFCFAAALLRPAN
jgi:hypothetical protein